MTELKTGPTPKPSANPPVTRGFQELAGSSDEAANTLRITQQPGKTDRQVMTEHALNPAANCTSLIAGWLSKEWNGIGLNETMEAMNAKAQAIHSGDLSEAETALFAQATALNAIFVEMTRRAGMNMGSHLPAVDTYMKLALKAQNQSRMTLETLAAIKNPPVVYARQANFANGHQQVVNNGVPTATHATKTEFPQSQLLESTNGERLDFGAQAAAGAVDPHMATVGAAHGAENTRGQSRHSKERRQGRAVAPGARGVEGTTGKPAGAEGGDA